MAAYEVLLLNTAVPQIQAAQAGDTYVVPRDIAVTADLSVTGNTTLGNASTDTVQVNGYMGVGGGPLNYVGLRVTGSVLGNVDQYGISSSVASSSGATSSFSSAVFTPTTAAASFTVANVHGLLLQNATKGAGSTITNQHGVFVADQTQGTNNYGITSAVSSGTDKWNIYASGTAANYLRGNTIIGLAPFDTPASNVNLTVTGDIDETAEIWVGTRDTSITGGQFLGGLGFYNSDNSGVGGAYLSGIKAFSVDSSGSSYLKFYSGLTNYTNDIPQFTLNTTEAVFNDPGNDYDFRVESDTNTHALFVQGSDGFVGIGTNSPTARLHTSISIGGTTALFDGTSVGGQVNIDVQNTNGSNASSRAALRFFLGATNTASIVSTNNAGPSPSLEFFTGGTERARITSGGTVQVSSGGSFQVGGTAARATTAGTNRIDIFDGTAPVGTLANGVSFYSASGEANVMDAAGNATLLSPHDSETNEWIFRSKHTPTGKVLRIDVERLLRFVNDHFGLDAVKEFVEE